MPVEGLTQDAVSSRRKGGISVQIPHIRASCNVGNEILVEPRHLEGWNTISTGQHEDIQ